MKKYTKTKKINFFQVIKYIQTHFYYQKIYVAVDLQQGAKLRAWFTDSLQVHNSQRSSLPI